MKKQLFGTYSLIALSIPAALFTLAPNAQAAGLVLGSTATSALTSVSGTTISNITNQSGLSATYTSGVTDFDSYVSTTIHNNGINTNFWVFGGTSGVITFNLGASYTLDALALWPLNAASSVTVRGFSLYADTDANTSNLGTLLGSFNAVDASSTPTAAQVFNFSATDTQYIQLQITSSAGTGTGLGEVAFRGSPAAVPEPLTILGAATAAAFGVAFKRRKSQG
jgi:hypothetical protein